MATKTMTLFVLLTAVSVANAQESCDRRAVVNAGLLHPRPPAQPARLFAVPDDGSGQLVELHSVSGEEVRRFDLPVAPGDARPSIAYDGDSLFYMNGRGATTLFELDARTGEVRDQDEISAGSGQYDGLGVLRGQVCVLDAGAKGIHFFDPRSDTVTRSLALPGSGIEGGLSGMSNPDALVVHGTQNGLQRILVIDPDSGEILESLRFAIEEKGGLAVVAGQVFVSDPVETRLLVVSRTGLLLREIDLPFGLRALGGDDTGSVSGGGSLYAIAGTSLDSIVELDPFTGVELRRFPAPEPASGGPDGLAFDGERVYFLNGFGSDQLWELDSAGGRVVDQDPVVGGSGDYDGLAWLDGKVYILDFTGDSILEFDPTTDEITRRINIDGTDLVGGLAAVSDPDRLLVTGTEQNVARVFEIDLETGLFAGSFRHTLGFAAGVAVVNGQIFLGDLNGTRHEVYTRDGVFIRDFTLPFAISAFAGSNAAVTGEVTERFDSIRGEITADEASQYVIDICEAGRYTFTTCQGDGISAFPVRLCLFDADGALVASEAASCDSGAEIAVDLAVGRYRLVVTSDGDGAGEFVLVFFSDVPNECPTCAGRSLEVVGEIEPRRLVSTRVSGEIDATSAHAYRLRVCEVGNYTFTFCRDQGTADFDTWLCVLDGEGNVIAENDDACDLRSQLVLELFEGAYSVVVSGFAGSSGSYTLSYQANVENACAPGGGSQRPGDCTQDGRVNLSDGVCLFTYLFLGAPSPLPCGDGTAAHASNVALLDHNGDGGLNLSDGIAILNYLFLAGSPPAAGTDCVEVVGCPDACDE